MREMTQRSRATLLSVAVLCTACVVEDDNNTGDQPFVPETPDAGRGGSGGEAAGGAGGGAGGQAFPPFDPPSRLTIATYNVENLFDLTDDPSHDEGEFTPGTATWNAARLADRMARMARVFKDLNADIVSVNEVENELVLGQLRDAIVDAGGPNYPYLAVSNSSDPRGIKPAVLSRYPITRSFGRPINRAHDCLSTEEQRPITIAGSDPEARPIFQVEINVDAEPAADLVLLANHWKAKGRTSYPCNDDEHRLRSALQLRELMLELEAADQDRDVLALGDFNSFEFEPPLAEGLQVSLDLSVTADIYDAWADAGVIGGRQTNDNRWNNIDNSSYQFSGDWTRLDHILLMHSLVQGTNGWHLERGSVGSFHAPYMLTGGRPDSWDARDGSGYSDHLPVRLTIVR
jgi:endonuclease/exonuclease/phosphatase family metal-dependent hydrolase